jgi:hypothetical protein
MMLHAKFKVPTMAPIIGGVYAHYKTPYHEYLVTGVSLNAYNDEWHVEYVPLYPDAVADKFNRSLTGWLAPARIDGEEIERYRFIRLNE